MSDTTIRNGTKILIQNQVYTVVAVVMHTLYVKYTHTCTDYDLTEEQIISKYKIEFIKEK